jgi:hypothetical protein
MRPLRLVAQVQIGAFLDSWTSDRKGGDGRELFKDQLCRAATENASDCGRADRRLTRMAGLR